QPDAGIENAPMQEQRETDKADPARHAAGDDRQHLFLRGADERFVHPVRRQLPEEMPKEEEQDTDVEKIAPPAQGAGAQHLRRIALPRVLIAIEACQAAHEEDRETDVRINDEKEGVEVGQDGVHFASCRAAPKEAYAPSGGSER